MCFGPVRILWDPPNQSAGVVYDDKLVLLIGFDLIEITGDRPHTASPNEYDMYFLARKRMETRGAKLCFWFPFQTDPMPMHGGRNDRVRKNRYFEQQTLYLRRSLNVKTPSDPRSYGWNEAHILEILPESNEQPADKVLRGYLDHLGHEKFTFASRLRVGKPIGHAVKDSHEQYFTVSLNGVIERGEIFHVYFRAREAYAETIAGNPCSGEAALYYYDADFDEDILSAIFQHNSKIAPVIPCAMLQVSMMFPSPAKILKNDRFFSKKKTKSRSFRAKSRISPTGREFDDWRWFVIFNAHRGYEDESFVMQWELPDCQQGNSIIKELIQILFTPEERDLAKVIMPEFDGLAYAEREAIRRVAGGEKLIERASKSSYYRARDKLLAKISMMEQVEVKALDDRVLLTKTYKVWERGGNRNDWDELFSGDS